MLKLWKEAGRNANLADRQKINVFDIYKSITKACLQRYHSIHKNSLNCEILLPPTCSSIFTRKETINSKLPSHLPPDPEIHSFKQTIVLKPFPLCDESNIIIFRLEMSGRMINIFLLFLEGFSKDK